MKVREVIQQLREAGFAPDRCKGSHQTWVKGDVRITVIINHVNAEASRIMRVNLKRVLAGGRAQ